MERPVNQKIINEFLRNANGKVDSRDMTAAMKGDTNALLRKLNAEDRAKVENMLNDREALEKLLKSDAARALMEKLKNGK